MFHEGGCVYEFGLNNRKFSVIEVNGEMYTTIGEIRKVLQINRTLVSRKIKKLDIKIHYLFDLDGCEELNLKSERKGLLYKFIEFDAAISLIIYWFVKYEKMQLVYDTLEIIEVCNNLKGEI